MAVKGLALAMMDERSGEMPGLCLTTVAASLQSSRYGERCALPWLPSVIAFLGNRSSVQGGAGGMFDQQKAPAAVAVPTGLQPGLKDTQSRKG